MDQAFAKISITYKATDGLKSEFTSLSHVMQG